VKPADLAVAINSSPAITLAVLELALRRHSRA
jgi:hypothetical protein